MVGVELHPYRLRYVYIAEYRPCTYPGRTFAVMNYVPIPYPISIHCATYISRKVNCIPRDVDELSDKTHLFIQEVRKPGPIKGREGCNRRRVKIFDSLR